MTRRGRDGIERAWGVLALALLGSASGCGGEASAQAAFQPNAPTIQPTYRADGTVDDRAMCKWRGMADREASETAGPGHIQPNVRRVWKIVGEGIEAQRILVCREIDTNFDGIKDVVRRYNDEGESLSEESDSNYDGRIDTWITFASGRLAEVRLDKNANGEPDEWKFYNEGKLSRIKRDTDQNGKVDVWEIYDEGTLERMGVDLDGDERVDQWNYDSDARRKREEEEDEGKTGEGVEDPGSDMNAGADSDLDEAAENATKDGDSE